MASARVFISALLLPIFAILAAATGFLDQGCNTSELPWYLEDGVAKTYCATHVCDSNVQTALNLNLCVGNTGGQLVAAQDGNFGNTCKDCSIVGNYDSLQCVCMDEQTGNWALSMLNLNTGFIYNWFGYLSCFNQHQTDIPVDYFCKDPTWQPDPNSVDGCATPSCQGPQADAGHCPTGTDAAGVSPASPRPTVVRGPD
ncbi:hypothetical protein PG985_012819 [Apiospora marii]|uniref:Cyanovirin-N domain-containing protein n=1 Tax=Apiospora marii TaxID=335849 RepID=A0ABR1RCA7_9PEZI